jgi:hypothetical protein
LKYFADNASIGYYYGYELVANEKDAGTALFDVKSDMGANLYTYWDGCHMMNLFDFNLYGDPSAALESEGDPSLTLTSPNGGESWTIGSTQNITWDAVGISGDVRIVLLKNGASVGTVIGSVPAAQGSYSWTVGQHTLGDVSPGTGYAIRIKQKGSTLFDESDAAFTIKGIEVSSPNGGESWTMGSTRNITWNAAGIPGNVRIVLLKNGSAVGTIIGSVPAAQGSYSWTVGQHTLGNVSPGTGYTIRIKEKGSTIFDVSDGSFSLL